MKAKDSQELHFLALNPWSVGAEWGLANEEGTGLPPCPTFKCRSLCDLVGVFPGPSEPRMVVMGENWYFLCILPTSPWPRAGTLLY